MDKSSRLPNGMINPIPKAKKPVMPSKSIERIFSDYTQQEILKLRKEKIFFSFRFLDTQHEAFNCGGSDVNSGWFLHLFDNLLSISGLNMAEFENQRHHYDIHPHDFNKTAFHYNETLNEEILEQISGENLFQFRLSSSGGRVHGIKYHNIIYVIWLDPYHNMNPNQRFGGLKYFDAPLNPYQELELKYNKLKEENETLEALLAEIE
jgi:hypothetical protein